VVARNVGLAAQRSVVEEKHFQEVCLPWGAARLRDRFLDAITRFISPATIPETTKQLHRPVELVFLSALKIKTRFDAEDREIEAIFPVSGSQFDDSIMVDRRRMSDGPALLQPSSEKRGPLVKLPLVPGLRICVPETPVKEDSEVEKPEEEDIELNQLYPAMVLTQ
jgi:hypothetical protein